MKLSKSFAGRCNAYVLIAAILGGLVTLTIISISENGVVHDYSNYATIRTMLGYLIGFIVIFFVLFVACVVISEPIAYIVRRGK